MKPSLERSPSDLALVGEVAMLAAYLEHDAAVMAVVLDHTNRSKPLLADSRRLRRDLDRALLELADADYRLASEAEEWFAWFQRCIDARNVLAHSLVVVDDAGELAMYHPQGNAVITWDAQVARTMADDMRACSQVARQLSTRLLLYYPEGLVPHSADSVRTENGGDA